MAVALRQYLGIFTVCWLMGTTWILIWYMPRYRPPMMQQPLVEDQYEARVVDEKYTAVFTLYPKYPPLIKHETMAPVSANYYRNNKLNRLFPDRSSIYPDGLYYVALPIGRPGKVYHLDIDMGIDVTWLQCDGPCINCARGPHGLYNPSKARRLDCNDVLCQEMQGEASNPYECEEYDTGGWSECVYDRNFPDESVTSGFLMLDFITLLNSTGNRTPTKAIIGCGYNQDGVYAKSPALTDGVMGLRNSKASLLSQLAKRGLVNNVLGQCLGASTGHLVFGSSLVPPSGMTWVPMMGSQLQDGYYQARVQSIHYGTKEVIRFDQDWGRGPIDEVTFDCGTSFTYFVHEVFEAIVSAVRAGAARNDFDELIDVDPNLPHCWGGENIFKSKADVRRYFKSIVLSFGGGKILELPPEKYLVDPKEGTLCLAIYNAKGANLEVTNIIGGVSMRGYLFVFDNVRDRIGWVRKNCQELL